MLDRFKRDISYLRISVTDKCNLRCRYCMPAEGVPVRAHAEFLSFEQITSVVRAGVRLGMTKVRLTGGEPLVKRGIVDLVRMIKGVEGVAHLGMTTNGTLLGQHVVQLRDVGLDSINVSLDTLNGARFREITRGGDIREVLDGIWDAIDAGFPVKINMVVLDDTPDAEVSRMRAYCERVGARLQLINHYALDKEKREGYRFDRPPSCATCNRVRLMADGMLKPCLHSDQEVKLDFSRLEESLREAVLAKPERGGVCTNREMSQIGG
jgi:GTP 3',8-cyclase